jgi:Spy/CpxP family protein refolding chaperone
MAAQGPSYPPENQPAGDQGTGTVEVELLHVVVARHGTQVSAQWGIHPQMKHDLQPDQWEKLNDLMAKVTALVGKRFAEILDQAEPDRPGTA